jgi:hypothetical protein
MDQRVSVGTNLSSCETVQPLWIAYQDVLPRRFFGNPRRDQIDQIARQYPPEA